MISLVMLRLTAVPVAVDSTFPVWILAIFLVIFLAISLAAVAAEEQIMVQ